MGDHAYNQGDSDERRADSYMAGTWQVHGRYMAGTWQVVLCTNLTFSPLLSSPLLSSLLFSSLLCSFLLLSSSRFSLIRLPASPGSLPMVPYRWQPRIFRHKTQSLFEFYVGGLGPYRWRKRYHLCLYPCLCYYYCCKQCSWYTTVDWQSPLRWGARFAPVSILQARVTENIQLLDYTTNAIR